MAQDLGTTTVAGTVTKTARERTFRTFIETRDGEPFTVTVQREVKTTTIYPDGTTKIDYDRTGRLPEAGPPDEGTTGADPAHYKNGKAGWKSRYDVVLADLLSLPGYFETGAGQRSRVYWEDIDDVVVFMLEKIVEQGKTKQLQSIIQKAADERAKELAAGQ